MQFPCINQLGHLGIADHRLDISNSSNHLWQLVADYIRQRWREMRDFVAEDPEAFLATLRINGEWVDHISILATARLLNLNIHIHMNDPNQTVVVVEGDEGAGEISPLFGKA